MCRVTMGHLRVTVGHIRVTLGHLKVTIGFFFSISKHKANTTELHPKVRQTCLYLYPEIHCICATTLDIDTQTKI